MPKDSLQKQNKQIQGIFIILLATACILGMNAYLLFYDRSQKLNEGVQEQHVDSLTHEADAYTMADVARYDTPENCWMAAYGMVYDLTPYVEADRHPGGQRSLTDGCGQEVTDSFDRIHSARAKDMLDDYIIGTLIEE